MEQYISLVGVAAAFIVLIVLMMKGINLFVTVMAASVVAIAFSGMNIYDTLTGSYMTGFADYYRQYYLVFFCGTLLGAVMELSGAATSIAQWVTKKFKDKAYLAIPGYTLGHRNHLLWRCDGYYIHICNFSYSNCNIQGE